MSEPLLFIHAMNTAEQYTVTIDEDILYIRFGKFISGPVIIGLLSQLGITSNQVQPRAIKGSIIDLSAVEKFEISYHDISIISKLRKEREAEIGGITSIYYAPTDIAFGMTRMYQSIMSDTSVDILIARSEKELADLKSLHFPP